MAERSVPVAVSLPPISQPLFDKSTGLVTEPWYRYFESQRNRTGGDIDMVDKTKVAASVADDKAVTADKKADVADEKAVTADKKAVQAQLTADALEEALASTDAEVVGLGGIAADHETRIEAAEGTLTDHETRIAALEAAVFP